MKKIGILAVMMVVALALGLAFIACDNGTTSGNTVPGNSFDEKMAWLQENAEDGGSYVIVQNSDEDIESVVFDFDGKSVEIILRGNKSNRTIRSNSSKYIHLRPGVTLVLDNNITMQNRSSNEFYSFIGVEADATLIMNNGAAIYGNSNSTRAAGVGVGGTFIMVKVPPPHTPPPATAALPEIVPPLMVKIRFTPSIHTPPPPIAEVLPDMVPPVMVNAPHACTPPPGPSVVWPEMVPPFIVKDT